MNKNDFGINGEHEKLGRELSAAEFKGYVSATLKGIDSRFESMKKNIDNKFKSIEENHCTLRDKVNSQERTILIASGGLIVITAVLSIVVAIALKLI